MSKLSNKEMSFINKAIVASNKSNMLMKHGCAISINGKYIASGYNTYRNQYNTPYMNTRHNISCSCHAEMDALHKAMKCVSFKTRKKVVQRSSKVSKV